MATRRGVAGTPSLAWPLPATFASGFGTRAPRIAQEMHCLVTCPRRIFLLDLLLLTYHTIKVTGLQEVASETTPPRWPVTPAADKRKMRVFIMYYYHVRAVNEM